MTEADIGIEPRFESRRGRGRLSRTVLALAWAGLILEALWGPAAARASCAGDCDASGVVTVDELVALVSIALEQQPVELCLPADTNGDGIIMIDEILTAVNNALCECPVPATETPPPTETPRPTDTPPPTPIPTNTRTRTPTFTLTRTPTSTPTPRNTPTPAASPANLIIHVINSSGTARQVCVSGMMKDGSVISMDTHYGCPPAGCSTANPGSPVCQGIGTSCNTGNENGCQIAVPARLAPGEWVHHIHVEDTGQYQHTSTLLLNDPAVPNKVEWTVFARVLDVTSGSDQTQDTGSLRHQIATANGIATAPVLIQFPRAVAVMIDQTAPLALQADGIVIDGTDAGGNPSAIDPFDSRTYSRIVRLTLPTGADQDTEIRGAFVLQKSNCQLIGLEIDRAVPTPNPSPSDPKHCRNDCGRSCTGDSQCDPGVHCEPNYCGQDADAIYIQPAGILTGDPNAVRNNRVVNCRIDGGATGKLLSSTGRDCISARNSGGTASDFSQATLVQNTEIANCWDKGVKVADFAYLKVEDSWVHDTIDTGIQATQTGRAQTRRNLVDNSGGTAASQVSANGIAANGGSSLVDIGEDVIRTSALDGILVSGPATAHIDRAYVSGTLNGPNGGNGISFNGSGITDTTMQGTAVVGNSGNGVTVALATSSTIDFSGGNNAFTGSGGKNFQGSSTLSAVASSQWQSCYAPNNTNPNSCNLTAIQQNDTSGNVSVVSPLPHRSTSGLSINAPGSDPSDPLYPVYPRVGKVGTIVRIRGSGFNAIDGGRTCTDLGNTNAQGTCVQFVLPRTTVNAEVLAVTPTELVVKSPIQCNRTILIKVIRKDLNGNLLPPAATAFCNN